MGYGYSMCHTMKTHWLTNYRDWPPFESQSQSRPFKKGSPGRPP